MYLRSKVVRCEDLVNVRTKLQFHKCLQFFFVFFLVFAPSLPFMGLNSAQSSTQHYQNSPIGINVGFLSSLILISHFACQLVHFLCKSTNLNNLFFFQKPSLAIRVSSSKSLCGQFIPQYPVYPIYNKT
jgi:hypothetical protein